ncbi:hypothetical protein ACFSF3_09065 [Vibrio chagasii]
MEPTVQIRGCCVCLLLVKQANARTDDVLANNGIAAMVSQLHNEHIIGSEFSPKL